MRAARPCERTRGHGAGAGASSVNDDTTIRARWQRRLSGYRVLAETASPVFTSERAEQIGGVMNFANSVETRTKAVSH